ncbi:MAG: FapA family protein [Spirochaetota bacterium]
MENIKSFLVEQEIEMDAMEREQVEVYGESIDECLKLAAKHLGRDLQELEYTVLQRGKKKFLFSEPFHIRVFPGDPDEEIIGMTTLSRKLFDNDKLADPSMKKYLKPIDVDARVIIKNYRAGVYMAVHPPKGLGKTPSLDDIIKIFKIKGIRVPDSKKIESILEEQTGELIRLSNSKLKAFMEAQIKVDVSQDWMRARVMLIPPKPGGRDIEVSDVVYELKRERIEYGIKEDSIKKMIEDDKYNEEFVAAEGDPPIHGKNAQIIYHVRTEKKIKLKEDAFGRVDYRDLNLIENVVVNQLLAEKVPAEKGKYGRNMINEIIEARDGQDVPLVQGKGTLLSDDGKKLTAEVNGQVLYSEGRIAVETVYKVNGDVGVKTGNITFLGSIVITGNVDDNFHVKASGNVEVYGTVQKAVIEADGDIIIRQGVTGRDEARIETTGGNVVAKFVQNANVITEKDVIVQESIMQSNVNAGGRIICKGKRAQIVGGSLKATQYIAAKLLGSSTNPPTEIIVGINPKVLKQMEDYDLKKKETLDKIEKLQKSLKTLKARKEADPLQFTEDNQTYMNKLEAGIKKLEKRMLDYDGEIQTLREYMEKTGANGRVYIEKSKFRGVSIRIKNIEDKDLTLQDLGSCMLYLDVDKIKPSKYVDPEATEKEERKKPKAKAKVAISG